MTRRGLVGSVVVSMATAVAALPSQVAVPPQIWGVVDPVVLGTCDATLHDQYVVDGGDGFAYRTWHPLADPSGCAFAHEHGDNPEAQVDSVIRAMPVRFGYAARRMPSPQEPDGHVEAHEGYKVFVVNRGDVNDEGRSSLIDSRIVAHMGTSAPKRFVLQHHSLDVDVNDGLGKFVSLRVMADTGQPVTLSNGSDLTGCDPRPDGVGSRSVMTLHPTCKQRPYEFWLFHANVGVAFVAVATAVFDPITARDPADPLRTLYVWDPQLDGSLDFPYDSRANFRGCDREHYAGPVYWYNADGQTVLTTDAMGQPVPFTHPHAIVQQVSAHYTIHFDASSRDGERQSQFKQRRGFCGPSLGLKN